ncbi:hypothetical protein CCP3SC15_380015 [Gammaproteobacteria bacterium]
MVDAISLKGRLALLDLTLRECASLAGVDYVRFTRQLNGYQKINLAEMSVVFKAVEEYEAASKSDDIKGFEVLVKRARNYQYVNGRKTMRDWQK